MAIHRECKDIFPVVLVDGLDHLRKLCGGYNVGRQIIYSSSVFDSPSKDMQYGHTDGLCAGLLLEVGIVVDEDKITVDGLCHTRYFNDAAELYLALTEKLKAVLKTLGSAGQVCKDSDTQKLFAKTYAQIERGLKEFRLEDFNQSIESAREDLARQSQDLIKAQEEIRKSFEDLVKSERGKVGKALSV